MLKTPHAFFSPEIGPIHLLQTPGLVPYVAALGWMEQRVADILADKAPECLWLLEHAPVYTSGARGCEGDIVDIGDIPLIHVRRGGRVTYHGPGQRIVYMMLDLRKRGRDLKAFLKAVETLLIATLKRLAIDAFVPKDRIGLWMHHQGQEIKVGAIGFQIRKWITFHGVAINVNPDMDAFGRIIPCGIKHFPVGALAAINPTITLQAFDDALIAEIAETECTTLFSKESLEM